MRLISIQGDDCWHMKIFSTCCPYTLFEFEQKNASFVSNIYFINNCKSRTALGHFAEGTMFKSAHVKCIEGLVDLKTETEYLNNVCPLVSCQEACITASGLNTEVFELIVRGHGLRHSQCTCRRTRDSQRVRVLGLDRHLHYTESCDLAYSRQKITDSVLAAEIGACSLDVKFADNFTIREFLTGSGLFKYENDEWMLKQSLVWDEESLLLFLQKTPLGVFENNPLIQCAALPRLIHSLVQKNKVFRLRVKNDNYRIFNAYDRMCPVSEDVKSLWHGVLFG